MRHLLLLLLLGFAVTFTSCRDDFEFEPSTGGLEFSRDTVYLDTVFTNIGSSTYTLKVYNRSNKDIMIPHIALGQGDNSKYRLMVDGIPGKTFNNVELLAKDSMFIFVETTINYADYINNETTFLYTDNIQFTSTNGNQKVELVTLVQDAVLIKPDRPIPNGAKELLTLSGVATDFQGHELATPEELHWTNQKPYVVYGYAMVPNRKTLVIDPGARVHFHADSGLIVDTDGLLQINGTASSTPALENEVIFEGDRLEPEYADVPGQWSSVLIFSKNDNTINHLTLKNANVGILMQPIDVDARPVIIPKLKIDNSQIYNSANYGVLARLSTITGTNIVANNAGQASVALTLGGDYNFKHCTFANYFNSNDQVPLLINNYMDNGDAPSSVSDLNANFDNCIMYGSGNVGISLERIGEDDTTLLYHITFNHSLIKIVDPFNQLNSNPLYKYTTNTAESPVYYNSCVIGKTSNNNRPAFEDAPNNKLNLITNDSPNAENPGPEGSADPAIAAIVPFDIKGVSRNLTAPDIGAYESQPAPAE